MLAGVKTSVNQCLSQAKNFNVFLERGMPKPQKQGFTPRGKVQMVRKVLICLLPYKVRVFFSFYLGARDQGFTRKRAIKVAINAFIPWEKRLAI